MYCLIPPCGKFTPVISNWDARSRRKTSL
jgi:hypothetical protein